MKAVIKMTAMILLLIYSASFAQQSISYTDNAIKVFADASFIAGQEAITAHYNDSPILTAKRAVMTVTKANAHYTYALNAFVIDRKPYKELVILTSDNKREFEFIAQDQLDNADLSGIEIARDKWIALCNAHNAQALIDTLYHQPTLYYNHRAPVTSKNELAKVYSYMNNPAYSLNLKPLHTTAVSKTMALEIGQCSGSYQGKYMIVWKKHPKFGWQVLVDSNI